MLCFYSIPYYVFTELTSSAQLHAIKQARRTTGRENRSLNTYARRPQTRTITRRPDLQKS